MVEFATKDSGARQQFETGSQRDTDEGKGRFDLVPYEALIEVGNAIQEMDDHLPDTEDEALSQALAACTTAWLVTDENTLLDVLREVAAYSLLAISLEDGATLYPTPDLWGIATIPYDAALRLAQLYERGATKYFPNNWRLGQPYSRVMQSMTRHAWQAASLFTDEDHKAAVAWNAIAVIHYILCGPEGLNDLALVKAVPNV